MTLVSSPCPQSSKHHLKQKVQTTTTLNFIVGALSVFVLASEHGCALPSAHVDDGPGPTATTTTISEIFRTDSDSTIDRKPAETRHSEGSASSNHPSSAQRSHFGIGEPREVQEARFCTRDDFLFAELLRESGLSREGSDRLIKLINRCIDGKGLITFSSYAELQDSRERYWKSRLTSVSPSPEIINAG